MSFSPYSPAAKLLSEIWETKKSIKTLAYDKSGNLKVSKATYAQVCHVLEHQKVLQTLLEAVPIKSRNDSLLYVLLYELLLGPNQKIRGGGAVKRMIVKKEAAFRDVLEPLQSTLIERVSFPRYVRVNTLKCTTEEAVEALKEYGQIYADKHVPNLLVLKPGSPVHLHEWVKSGKLILQDKSSCFSALCLVHGNKNALEADCMDPCAAPGNKTSHCASLLSSSKVYACDRNEKRLELLDRRMKLFVSNKKVVTKHVDFLKTKPFNYSSVKGILLDPSCSGSGIFTSLDRMADDEEETSERIEHLANFQLTALKHAMTFDSVDRIVYSTCSIHEEENEMVVKQALEANEDWQVCAPYCLRDWQRRGHAVDGLTKKQSDCLIRADRGDDTNGFFVAYFERNGSKTTSKKTKSGALVVPDGVTVYDGEFAAAKTAEKAKPRVVEKRKDNKKSDGEEKGDTKSKVMVNTTKAKKKDRKSHSQSEDSTKDSTKVDKIVAKKKAKKLAWKQKQMEQKKMRLLKKEAGKAKVSPAATDTST